MRRRVVERMLDMPQIDDIRRLWSEGYCISEIARRTGHDRKTVRKFLDEVDFSPEPPAGVVPGPSKLDPYKPTIDSISRCNRSRASGAISSRARSATYRTSSD